MSPRPSTPSDETLALAQQERAARSWQLVIPASAAALGAEGVDALRRVLRVKRFECATLQERLPGTVRSGARVDLEPLRVALEEADVPCRLERRGGASSGGEPSDPAA